MTSLSADLKAAAESPHETSTIPRCEKCGKLLEIGRWPHCPHEPVQPTRFLWNRVK